MLKIYVVLVIILPPWSFILVLIRWAARCAVRSVRLAREDSQGTLRAMKSLSRFSLHLYYANIFVPNISTSSYFLHCSYKRYTGIFNRFSVHHFCFIIQNRDVDDLFTDHSC